MTKDFEPKEKEGYEYDWFPDMEYGGRRNWKPVFDNKGNHIKTRVAMYNWETGDLMPAQDYFLMDRPSHYGVLERRNSKNTMLDILRD